MELSFLKVLNTSISASWLILAVIGARLVLKKAPKSIHCLLWALVAIRLICPFSIESVFSLIPSPETVPEIYLTLEGEQREYGAVLEVVGNSIYPQSHVQAPVGASIDRVQVQDLFLTVIWLAGMAVLGAYALISYLRLRHRVAPSVKLGENIWACDYIDTPFILGVIRPRIYLPSTLEGAELVHVLSHERAHLKRKDHWWKPLGFALLTVYWFNPLIWLAYILLCRDIEMACDEKVIRDLDAEEKKAYSGALLSCSVKRHMIAACPLAFGEVGVKARVKSVLNYRKPAFWMILIAVIVCVVVAVCFLTDPVERTTPAVIFEDLSEDQIQWAQATFWEEESEHLVLTEEQIAELVKLLKAMDSGAYVEDKRIDHKLSVMLNCGSKEILVQWDGEFTTFVYDSETAALLKDTVWAVEDEELNRFLSGLGVTQPETEAASKDKIVSMSFGIANMAVLIPEGWEYEEIPYTDNSQSFGVAFWPEGVSEGRVVLAYHMQGFGVCGTGLETKPALLANGENVSFGYYDGNKIWSYMTYEDLPGSYVAQTEQVDGWWADYEGEVERILGAAKLAEGYAHRDEIVAVAQEALQETARKAVESFDAKLASIAGAPTYMAVFDSNDQVWRVGLYFLFDSSPRGEVYLDVYGNLLDWEDWGITLYAEDITPRSLTLVCRQSGKIPGDEMTAVGGYQAQLMTGQPYWLEQLVEGVWVAVPAKHEEMAWTMEGWMVNRNDTTSWKVNWSYLYGELEPGNYRIGKGISMSQYLGNWEDQVYYANFQITEPELSVEDALEIICSSPAEQSNPGAYIEAHRAEYDRLIQDPEATLRYCFGEFLNGGQNDLRGHIMASACKEIVKDWDGDELKGIYMTGQDWFNAYYEMALERWIRMEKEEILTKTPAAAILKELALCVDPIANGMDEAQAMEQLTELKEKLKQIQSGYFGEEP